MIGSRLLSTLVVSACALSAAPARAQTFPDRDAWTPLLCGLHVMTDLYRDQSGAIGERDLVGDLGAPAGYSASDASFLYLRMRLDGDPAPAGKLRPFAWGVAVSVDKAATNYELLLSVNGNANAVELYRNTATTLPDDPTDPADQPPVASYPFTSRGRVEEAVGSGYGKDADYLLSFAIPWSALTPLGLSPTTPVALWVGTSSTPGVLNADLACHDGALGAPHLSTVGGAAGPTTIILDAQLDSDGDGYPDRVEVAAGSDPASAASIPAGLRPGQLLSVLDLEGGGGCSLGGASPPRSSLLPLVLLALALVFRSRSRR